MSGKSGRSPDGTRDLREMSGNTGGIPDETRDLRELSGKRRCLRSKATASSDARPGRVFELSENTERRKGRPALQSNDGMPHGGCRLSRLGVQATFLYENTPPSMMTGCRIRKWQLPTLPPGGAVPSAMVSLTSLFGMGRGGSSPL